MFSAPKTEDLVEMPLVITELTGSHQFLCTDDTTQSGFAASSERGN
jgi:hypothetical protein